MTINTSLLPLACALLVAGSAAAQESRIGADIRREKEHVAAACDDLQPKALAECAYTLFTASPLHIAAGSLAPQNGMAFGLAFAERFTPNESWRLSWNADAVAAPSGAWRAGVYLKAIRTPDSSGVSVRPAGAAVSAPTILPREVPVFDVVAQRISLPTVSFYGIGPNTRREDRTTFGETQTIVGGSMIYPVGVGSLDSLRPSVVGGIHLRSIDVNQGRRSDFPSIAEVFDENAAPGLTVQDTFVQFTEGIRLKPSLGNGAVRASYLLAAEQFRTGGAGHGSFARWTADLRHEIPLYRRAAITSGSDLNGPDECSASIGASACPPVRVSRNREGAVTIRLLATTTSTSSGDRVPFYLQPTLGGSDLNGSRVLAGYDDYRFRGPGVVLIQEGIEHSLWGPLGAFVLAEHGRVANADGALDFADLKHSATVGLTLRAGGFPMINVGVGFGGESRHVILSMSANLLGGGGRPSLY